MTPVDAARMRVHPEWMDAFPDLTFSAGTRRLRLETLIRLRWLALFGQTAAILGVYFILGFNLPLIPALSIIGLSVALNLALQTRFSASHRLQSRAAAFLLAFDILQLAALLFLTGGLENPFAFMFLAPVLISATTLEPRQTLLLGGLATACSTILLLDHLPLPWSEGGSIRIPELYLFGVYVAILLGLGFISIYAWRVSEEARQLSDALQATELALAREQSLSAIDGLAAAAAHQLGTPLATIALVVNEMDRMNIADPVLKDDVLLLKQQAQRCREILGKISSLGEEATGPLATVTLPQVLEEAAAPYRGFGKTITINCEGPAPIPVIRRNPGLLYGLGNIIENAVDYGVSSVHVKAVWHATEIVVSIEDDGPGFAPEILWRLGDPYLSTRRIGRLGRGKDANDLQGGMGLGLFIAKTLIERSGGVASARNIGPSSGACVDIRWQRHRWSEQPGEASRMELASQA
jgi:two-component system, sensor histidine kinase RegB